MEREKNRRKKNAERNAWKGDQITEVNAVLAPERGEKAIRSSSGSSNGGGIARDA